jgi:hypothetical protein
VQQTTRFLPAEYLTLPNEFDVEMNALVGKLGPFRLFFVDDEQ